MISVPSACAANIRQERIAAPSTITVHAPHTPCSQPTWVPVSLRWWRSASAKFVRGSTSIRTGMPLTLKRLVRVTITLSPTGLGQRLSSERARAKPQSRLADSRRAHGYLPADRCFQLPPRRLHGLWPSRPSDQREFARRRRVGSAWYRCRSRRHEAQPRGHVRDRRIGQHPQARSPPDVLRTHQTPNTAQLSKAANGRRRLFRRAKAQSSSCRRRTHWLEWCAGHSAQLR